jgi:3-phosphoshikimate 1-carboxyvinyltransferase
MRKSVSPAELEGTIAAPPSKSVMQRATAAALLSDRPVSISNPSRCDDAEAALRVAHALGASLERKDGNVIIAASAGPRETTLNCGESGLCVRMFAPIAALYGREIRLIGRGSLRLRPMGAIERPLSELGASCTSEKGFLPLTVKGPLTGGQARLDGSLGSQFLTGLLMALPKAEADSELIVERLTSLPYVRLTLRVLEKFGISVSHQDFQIFRIPGKQRYQGTEFRVEGDWSGAAFMMVAGALAGVVRIRELDRDSLQGDAQILEVLARSGANVTSSRDWFEVSRAPLKGFEFDVTHCPDLAPPLVVLAARAQGISVIEGMERLTAKESNRPEALVNVFGSLGVDIRRAGGRLIIRGGTIQAGIVDSHGDHRIAMAAAVAACAAEGPVIIEGAECVSKSYPDFYRDLSRLGGNVDE